jgi:hypothetical protein
VADQGVSTPSHARHAAAEPCRRATAPRRALSARGRERERGEGGGESAGGPSRLRPVGQKRGRGLLAPPFPFSIFFLNFFSQILFQKHFDYFQIIFTIFTQKQSCSKTKTLPLCFNKQDQIPNRI